MGFWIRLDRPHHRNRKNINGVGDEDEYENADEPNRELIQHLISATRDQQPETSNQKPPHARRADTMKMVSNGTF